MTATSTPKRKRSAWFAFYPDDFSGGTRGMSLAGRGAFLELLSYQFAKGSVPSDDRIICRIIGAFPDEWEAIREEVLEKFEAEESGNLVNLRMQKERDEREGIRSKRVEAINKRWNKTDTNVSGLNIQDEFNSKDSVDTSSSSTPATSKSSSKTTPNPPKSPKGDGLNFEILFPLPKLAQEILTSWVKYRKEKKKPLTVSSWEILVRDTGNNPAHWCAGIEDAMRNGYQGIVRKNVTDADEEAMRSRIIDAARATNSSAQTTAEDEDLWTKHERNRLAELRAETGEEPTPDEIEEGEWI